MGGNDKPDLVDREVDYDSLDDEGEFDLEGNYIERKKVRIKIKIPQSMQRKKKQNDAKKIKTKQKKFIKETNKKKKSEKKERPLSSVYEISQ